MINWIYGRSRSHVQRKEYWKKEEKKTKKNTCMLFGKERIFISWPNPTWIHSRRNIKIETLTLYTDSIYVFLCCRRNMFCFFDFVIHVFRWNNFWQKLTNTTKQFQFLIVTLRSGSHVASYYCIHFSCKRRASLNSPSSYIIGSPHKSIEMFFVLLFCLIRRLMIETWEWKENFKEYSVYRSGDV